jgi:uncharacterized membrane protein
MLANRIVTEKKQIYTALLTIFSVKATMIAAMLAVICLVLLAFFMVVITATVQLCNAIGQVWNQCNAIEHLLFLLIAWLILYKSLPHVARCIAHIRGF